MKDYEPKIGDEIRVKGSRRPWTVQTIEVRRSGTLLGLYGPLGSLKAQYGKVVWLGSRPLKIKSLVRQGNIIIQPGAVKLLRRPRKGHA
jgi:hypothetical protein